MRAFRKATIKEVAARAGVSTTTVSLFVSGREDVCSSETAQRVRAAVAALDYAPSPLNRRLHKHRTRTIGVCMLSAVDPNVKYGNVFFERLWRGITVQADVENYALLYYPSSVREAKTCQDLLDGRADGLLLHSRQNARPARLAAAGMPTVVLGRSRDLPDACGTVYASDAETVSLALSHLWSLGHRRIAHIAGPLGEAGPSIPGTQFWADDIAVNRLEAYRVWMQARNVYSDSLVAFAQAWSLTDAAGVVAAWRELADPPTAVFCANDAQAVALIAAAQAVGWRVPEELSIVGVDNSTQAERCDPPLTSVEVPVEDIGRAAVRTLLQLFQGAPLESCQIELPVTELVLRASTARPHS